MPAKPPLQKRLIDAADSVLVVIDMQDSFFNKYEKAKSEEVISKALWLLRVAQKIGVPVIAMAEDIPHSGNLNVRIAQALPVEANLFNKDFFGCGNQPDIRDALKATGRGTAVLIGMETDVCVAHSAISLIEHGFDVAVVQDATATTAGDENIGLMRIRGAGGVICSVKSLYYEWLRSVSGICALLEKDPDLEGVALPDGLVL